DSIQMTKSEFRIPNGYVKITDREFKIDTNPIEGLKRIYRRNKKYTIVLVVLWAIFYFVVFFTNILPEIKSKIIYGISTLAMLLVVFYCMISDSFGKEYAMIIDRNSVKRIEYDWVKSMNTSKIKILYVDGEGNEKSQHVMITLLGRGEEGRLNSALSVLNNEGIETNVGTYYTGEESSDTAT